MKEFNARVVEKYGFKAKTSINEGILKTIHWFVNNNKKWEKV